MDAFFYLICLIFSIIKMYIKNLLEDAKMKENKQAVTMVATGIKCDNPECQLLHT